VAPGHTVEEVLEQLEAALAGFLASEASPEKVETAVNNWKKRFFQRMESVAGRAGLLLGYNNMEGDPGWVQSDLDRYLGVTSESVMEVARRVLDDAHRVTIIVRPESAEGAE
jgi:zinc protease